MQGADAIAAARQETLVRINKTATTRALKLWDRVDVGNLDASWAAIAPDLSKHTNAAQYAAAAGSDRYTDALSASYGFDAQASRLEPLAFVGVDGSGRSVDTLLHGAVTSTKTAIGSGFGRAQAFEVGASYLAVMIKTVLADMARGADMTSAVGKGYEVMVRVVEPGACGRCCMLAGATQFRAFKRHPACKCTVQAIPGENRADYSPEQTFAAMSPEEQSKAFTKAGAEAIRNGADMNQIVSARRGAKGIGYSNKRVSEPGTRRNMTKTTIGTRADGSPVRVYTTREGTTRHGMYGWQQEQLGVASARVGGGYVPRSTRTRLMPESILEIAGGDARVAQTLLRDGGYIFDTTGTSAEQTARALADRATADSVYAAHGIRLAG